MLVLSRREKQKIVFPDSQITVEVLRVKGNNVRLGIAAPSHVRVMREELAELEPSPEKPTRPADDALRPLRHLLRNQLQTATFGLALLRHQIEVGQSDEVEETLARLEAETRNLRQQLSAIESPTAAALVRRTVRRALVVEDNQNERELLAGFLRISGFDVATAGDGSDALDYLASHAQPDVLLLDMMMPRCDGPTTVREIRSDPRMAGLKIFAVSGCSQKQLALDSGPQGVDRWFPKPVDPSTLVRALNGDCVSAL